MNTERTAGTATGSETRRAVTIGVEKFSGAYEQLSFASALVRDLSSTLITLGYETTMRAEPELTSGELGAEVRERLAASNASDLLVVHVLTHGQVAEGNATVYLLGSDAQVHDDADVAQWLKGVQNVQGRPLTLFLLDLCQSGTVARLPWQYSLDGPIRGWVIAASQANKPAYDGRFTRAVINVLRDLATGALGVDQAVEHVALDTVAKAIRREVNRLTAPDDYPQEVTASLLDISADISDLAFFPNPAYRHDARVRLRAALDPGLQPFLDDLDEGLDARHFVERAAGTGPLPSSLRDLVGCFTGRAEELRKLSPWLSGEGEAPLQVVTGSPGTGKSALLGVLVCAAHPKLHKQTEPIWSRMKQRPVLNERRLLAAVHARRRDTEAVVRSLSRQLGLDGEAVGAPAALVAAVVKLPAQPVIVLDALDEADNGVGLMNKLLLPLAAARRPDGRPAARLLVGVRHWDEFTPLLDSASAVNGLVDLDHVRPEVLANDLYDYVADLLRAVDLWRRRGGAVGDFATEVSEVLSRQDAGRREWGEFLVAGLYTRYLLTIYPEPPVKDGEARALGAKAPRTLPDVLELDLDAHEDVPLLRPVITTLAHARGQGMPLTVLTRLVATVAYGTAEVQRALTVGRFYLRQSTDTDGSVLYRLFHQGLADHLRQVPQPELLDRLLGTLGPAGSRDFQAAEPYVLRHALEHAVESGRAGAVLAEPSFLLQPEPATLAPLLTGRLADVYCASLNVSGETAQVDRAALAMNAVRAGMPELAAAISTLPGEPPLTWQPLWAAGRATPRETANTFPPDAEGLTIGATISDGVLQTWDMVNRRPLWLPLRVTPAAWAIGQLDSLPIALTGHEDGTVQAWDLTKHGQTGRTMHKHASKVTVLALDALDDLQTAVAGTADGMVTMWHLAKAQPAGVLTDAVSVGGHRGGVTAVAMGSLNGTPIALTGGGEGLLRTWDLAARESVGDGTAVHNGPVSAIAISRRAKRPVFVTLSEGGVAKLWDLSPRGNIKARGQLSTGYQARASAIAIGLLGGREIVVTGNRDGTLQLWDLRTQSPIGLALHGHQRRITSIALGEVHGKPIAATGAIDGTMRIWNLEAGRSSEVRVAGRLSRVVTSAIVRLTPTRDPHSEWESRVAQARNRLAQDAAWPAVQSLAFSPELGAALLGTEAGTVSVVETDSGKPRAWIAVPESSEVGAEVTAIKCGPVAGQPVAVLANNRKERRVVDLTTYKPIRAGSIDDPFLVFGPKPVSSLIIVDGSLVKVSGDVNGDVQIQDHSTTAQVLSRLHAGSVTAVASQYVNGLPLGFTGGRDGKIRVLKLPTGQVLDVIDVAAPVFAIEVTATGDLLVGAGMQAMAFRHFSAVHDNPRDRKRLLTRIATCLRYLEVSRSASQP